MIKYKTNYNHFEILITNTEMKGSFYYSNKCEFNLRMIIIHGNSGHIYRRDYGTKGEGTI